ncbi:hemerythrin domain-containing protein [Streptomyces sp. NPDC003327]
MASPDGSRAAALSRQLTHAHQELRRRIGDIRSNLGRSGFDDAALRTHCLAFCSALTTHHEGEDEGMFADLVRERPDLAPTIAKLVEDHELISSILTRVRALADGAAASSGADLRAVAGELDGLTAIMESHFAFEERTITAALDAAETDGSWSERVFRFGPAS